MKRELYLQKKGDERLAALFEGDKLIECRAETAELSSKVGDIYRGKVRRIVPEMAAAFVDIGLNKTALLDLRDAVDLSKKESKEKTISDVVSEGEVVWVQVVKDGVFSELGLSEKGVRVSTKLQIESRYFIYFAQGSHVGASRKVEDQAVREQRISGVCDWQKQYGKKGACIIRTEAFDLTEDDFYKELEKVFEKATELFRAKREANKIGLIYKPLSFVEKALNDFDASKIDQVFSSEEAAEIDISSLLEKKQFYTQVEFANQSVVELESGASLVIEVTEALVSVDVNTGSALENGLSILDVNLEALTELAYQLTLRKLAGTIFVDFINMQKKADIKELTNTAKQIFNDGQKFTIVHGMTKLGFLELSVKRVSASLSQMSKLSSLLALTKG